MTLTELANKVLHDSNELCSTRTRMALYGVLSGVMQICEWPSTEDVRREFESRPRGARNRKYVEHSSDIYVEVCRYVLDGIVDPSTLYRYSTVLREANKRGVCSADLAEYLAKNGGMNNLWNARQVGVVARKMINLTTYANLPLEGEFVLRLRYVGGNHFEVVRTELSDV